VLPKNALPGKTSQRPTDCASASVSNDGSTIREDAMNTLLSRLSPSITNMIRMDHTHVLTTFHQYQADTSPRIKKGLADTICVALEIHAQLEEEIFYPAMRAIADSEMVQKSAPEHDQMRRLITQLRNLEPGHASYDETYFELMNNVMHHVADEETLLLPAAERVLADRLGELGAEMTKRRLQLAAPRSGEIAGSMARSVGPRSLMLGAGALLACSYLVGRPRAPHREIAQHDSGVVAR
jgi:hemerythrin superfamily protein